MRTASFTPPSIALLLLTACSLLLTGCASRPVAAGPNVVLILVDTLRADHLSLDGYERDTSPALAALAEEGVYFERFYAHSAITRPSVATLFTSRFVSGHGIANHGALGLSRTLPRLPRLLRNAGYRTLAFVTNPQIHPAFGFDDGFDHFEPLYARDIDPARLSPGDLVKVPASEVFAAVRAALATPTERPFFTYIHLIEPHGPYQPLSPFVERFTDPDYDGPISGTIEDFTKVGRLRSHPEDLDHFSSLYDAEIATVDAAIGSFVAWLRSEGLLADTHLIITADHGEELLEHGGTGHDYDLYEETVRIPLLWLGPGLPQGWRSPALAGLVDVLPTLFDVLDLPLPPETVFQGRSLRPLWTTPEEKKPTVRPSWREALFLEGPWPGQVQRRGRAVPKVARGIVTPQHKMLVRDCVLHEAICGELEILDLSADPGEQDGLPLEELDPSSAEILSLLRRYRQALGQALSLEAPAVIPQGQLPAEDVERLESLGYIQH